MTPDETLYYALIGDIVGSRDLENRAEVQRQLESILETLNRDLGRSARGPVTPLRLTAGDEIQVLLHTPVQAVDIVVRIAEGLYPVQLAWGLGVGPITTDPGEDVALLDGPCFHHARTAVEEAAAGEEWLRMAGVASPHGEAVSALFRLMGVVRSRWKPAQMRYIRGARDHLQKSVASMHDVDESTVSKALRAARFRDVEEGEAAARALLEWIAGHAVPVPPQAEKGRAAR